MDLKEEKPSPLAHDDKRSDLPEITKGGSGSGSGSSSSSPSASASALASKQLKSCSDCHTTRTPLWRGGPAGPKSLCNACGIKYNKKRRELLGLDKGKKKKKRNEGGGGGGRSLKMKLMALGGEMKMLKRSGKLLGKLREEEQAALLLMALSCGYVYA